MLMKFRFPLSVIALVVMIFVWKTLLFKNFPNLVPSYTVKAEVTAISLTAVKVIGQVTFEGKPLREKTIISKAGLISTDKGSLVILGFGENFSSKIKIGPESSVDVSDIKALKVSSNDKLEFNINQGVVFFKIYNPTKTKILNVKTPTMSMGIRGTTFIVEASDEKSVLLVQEGRVEVVSNKGKPEIAEAGSGFEARLANELLPIDLSNYKLDWNIDNSVNLSLPTKTEIRREKLDLPSFIEAKVAKAQEALKELKQRSPEQHKNIQEKLKALELETEVVSKDEQCLQSNMHGCEFTSEHFKNDIANLKNGPTKLSINPAIKANLQKDFETAKKEIVQQKEDLNSESENIDKSIQTEEEKVKTIVEKFEQWKSADEAAKKNLLKDLAELLNSSELQDAYNSN